ncbi:MAG: NAD-dependent epimerase/dehydratase family protein [Candidatus Omnitrophica bacterium]|nr:NAD-dependent epimerase/dehydratase family protein [Candidatus Omnitrophota bacterium]
MSVSVEGSKILITGGGGFVGSFVADQLLPMGVEKILIIDNFVRGSRDNLKEALSSGKVDLVEGDIRDRELLNNNFQGVDYCFHLAALRITHCAAEPRQALEVMYDGTFNVLEASVEHKVKKLVFASSASIYGQAVSFPTSEDHHPYGNSTLYGAAKIANECMLKSFQQMYGLSYVALRYFNIYGPRMDIHGKYTEVLIRWYDLIRQGQPPVIFGDGSQTMDFIYIEDIARATILALTSPTDGEVFNIASGIETSLKELCEVLLEVMGSSLKPQFVPVPDQRKKVEVMRRLADVSKARKRMGFQYSLTLKQGLQKLVDWLDTQRKFSCV